MRSKVLSLMAGAAVALAVAPAPAHSQVTGNPTDIPVRVGTVVPTLLSIQLPASIPPLGPMIPGMAATYDSTFTVTLSTTTPNATLSIADADNGTGRLGNGTSELASVLQVRATNTANPNTAFTNLRGVTNPVSLLSYTTPLAAAPVSVTFRQAIAANQALTAGAYAKTVMFTLSTATP